MAEQAQAQAQPIVVVAGASGEAGHAIAEALEAAGMRVAALGTSADRLADVAATARYVYDLTDPSAVSAMAEQIRSELGPVDGLIHLVGGWRAGQSDEDFEWLERHILTTLRNTTRAFRPDLTASSAGRLAIVSSTSVDRPTWGNANYATVKSAAETWLASVASGWKKDGTAAAVTFVVTSLGEGGTPPQVLAERIAALWDTPTAELNGSRILLTS